MIRPSLSGPPRRPRAPALAALLALAAATPLTIPACGTSPAAEEVGCLFADPHVHRVVVQGCQDSSECPDGTFCDSGAVAPGDRWIGCKRAGGAGSCRALGSVAAPSALVNGFGVKEMKLARSVVLGGSVTYSWTAPAGTEAVVCAVFGCPPEIAPVPDRQDATGLPVREIVNFDRCALRFARFSAEETSAPISDLPSAGGDLPRDLEPDRPAEEETPRFTLSCESPDSPDCPRPLTMLAVGCWAYGATEILAASRLESLDVSDFPPWRAWVLPANACTPDDDGRTCILEYEYTTGGVTSLQETFGSCRTGQCVERCSTDDHCAALPVETPSPGSGGSSSSAGSGGGSSSTSGSGGSSASTGGSSSTSGSGGDTAPPLRCLCPRANVPMKGRPFVGQCGVLSEGADSPDSLLLDSEECQF